MEETTLDETINTPKGDLNPDNTSINSNNRPSCHIKRKAETTHVPVSSSEAPSNKIKSAELDVMKSDICLSDSRAAPIPQSSKARIGLGKDSVGHQIIAAPKEYFANTLHSISECGDFDDELPGPPTSEAFYAKYRKSGPSLMTLHMFTGSMNGKAPIYVPVYKRDNQGKLLKLMGDRSGRWEYLELRKLTEDEVEGGLKILEEPKAQVVLQSVEPIKPVCRRTLADFGLPETESKGGWGWL